MYVNDSDPGGNTYEAYQRAQEDLILQQNEERIQRQAAQDETIDVSNLKGYRVSNSTTYMYVVAENGGEAAEIATKMDPERFPNIADITVQDAGSIGADTLIRGMYARQQAKLSELPAQQDTQSSNNDFRTYTVTNTETGQARRFAATSQEDAINIARREYPALFSTLNVTAAVDSSSMRGTFGQPIPAFSEPRSARISDLRYYRVERQDASGRADLAASSPEDAMNRAREQNPTWRNSPLAARIL
jgi:hypothetical protein